MIKFTSVEGTTIVEHTSEMIDCTDVARAFYYFLLGVSFQKKSICDAFTAIVEEYEDRDDTHE